VDVTDENAVLSSRKEIEEEFAKGTLKALFNISGVVRLPSSSSD